MKKKTGVFNAVIIVLLVCSMCLTGCGKGKQPLEVQENKEEPVVEEAVLEENPVEEATVEEPAEEESAGATVTDAYSAYQLYLGMGGNCDLKAIVDDNVGLGYSDDYEFKHVGESYTFEELSEEMLHGRNLVGDEAKDLVPYFAILNVGGEDLLALKYTGMNIYDMNDDSFSVLILKYENEELHITYSYSEWSRQSTNLQTNGVLLTSGSAGAGERIMDGGFIDSKGQYHQVYMNDSLTDMWIGMSEDVDNSAYMEAYIEGEDNTGETNLSLNVYHFGEEKVFVPEAYLSGLTKQDEYFLELLKESGAVIATVDEVGQRIEDTFMELGGIENYDGYAAVAWNSIRPGEHFIIPAHSSDWTASWNYRDVVSEQITITPDLSQRLADAKVLDEEFILSGEYYNTAESEEEIFYYVDAYEGDLKGYKFYLSNHYDGYILTPGNYCLKLKGIGLVDFIYGQAPEMVCDDFDEDGDDELFIKSTVFYGTGFLQNSAFMVDGVEFGDGKAYWAVHHLVPQKYIEILMNHVYVADGGDDVIVNVDGVEKTVSKEGDDAVMELFADQRVEIRTEGKNIIVETEPVLFSENNPVGLPIGHYQLTLDYSQYYQWNEAGFEVLQ